MPRACAAHAPFLALRGVLQGCEVAVAALTSGKAAFEEQRYGQARQKFTSAMELDTSLDGCIRAEASLSWFVFVFLCVHCGASS